MSDNLQWTQALRDRFGFETPAEYRALEVRGLFRWLGSADDLTTPGDRYLWLNDMEWYPPDKLRDFRFASYHKSGFVPFAHTAGGDYWCWYPTMAANGVTPVVRCARDSRDGDLYAPDFATALWRQALEYGLEETLIEPDQRTAMLRRFLVDLGPIWSPRLLAHIEQLVTQELSEKQYKSVVAIELGEQYTQIFNVRWME